MARDICVQFGKTVRQLRKQRGWRQIDLAEQAGINKNYISDVEIGKKEVCLRMIQLLAVALAVKPADLLKGSE